MSWLIFTILAIICRSAYSIAAKLLTNTLSVSYVTQNFLMTFTTLLPSLALSPLLGGISLRPVWHNITQVVIMVLSAAFGGIAFFKGQQKLDASVAQIAFSSILFWGLLFSFLFLGSRFDSLQLIGVCLLIGAIVLANAKRGKLRPERGIGWILLSAAFFAAFQVSSATLSKQLTTATYLLLSFGGPTIIIVCLFPATIAADLRRTLKQPKVTVRSAGFVALTTFGYYIFSFKAYQRAPDAGIVVILLTTQVVLSVILGILLLRERDRKFRKLTAGFVAIIAGGLIKAG